jgi:hypothetical protein
MRPAETILFPHLRSTRRRRTWGQQYNQPKAPSYDCKVGLHSLYFALNGFGEPSGCGFGCCLTVSSTWGAFLSVTTGNVFYDLAPRWWLFIRDDQLTFGTFVKVVILSLALSDDDETEKSAKRTARFKIVPRLGWSPFWYIPQWSLLMSEARRV